MILSNTTNTPTNPHSPTWIDSGTSYDSLSNLTQVNFGEGIILFGMGAIAGIVAFAATVRVIDDLIMRRYFPRHGTFGSEITSIMRWLFPHGWELPLGSGHVM